MQNLLFTETPLNHTNLYFIVIHLLYTAKLVEKVCYVPGSTNWLKKCATSPVAGYGSRRGVPGHPEPGILPHQL